MSHPELISKKEDFSVAQLPGCQSIPSASPLEKSCKVCTQHHLTSVHIPLQLCRLAHEAQSAFALFSPSLPTAEIGEDQEPSAFSTICFSFHLQGHHLPLGHRFCPEKIKNKTLLPSGAAIYQKVITEIPQENRYSPADSNCRSEWHIKKQSSWLHYASKHG